MMERNITERIHPAESSAAVIIAGAGPAGLAAALAFAQRGVRSLILEPRTGSQTKVCGEGLMPTGLAVLRRLGVAEFPDESSRALVGIRYIAADGGRAEARFAEGPGRGMRRETLSSILLAHAEQDARIRIEFGVECVGYAPQEGSVAVRVRRRSPRSEQTFQTRLLVGADGLRSQTRRLADLELGKRGPERWGARQHFQLTPWTDFVEVYCSVGLEAYVTPAGPQAVNIAFLWDRRRIQPSPAGSQLFAGLLARFPELQARLNGASALDAPAAIGPLYRAVASPIAEGLALVGDAAGYLDAITGEGLSLAFEGAEALADASAPHLLREGGPLSAAELAGYRAAYARLTRNYYVVTRLVLELAAYPRLFSLITAALGLRTDLFTRMLSVNMGRRSLWTLLADLPGFGVALLRAFFSGRGAVYAKQPRSAHSD